MIRAAKRKAEEEKTKKKEKEEEEDREIQAFGLECQDDGAL